MNATPAWQIDIITTPPTIETEHARIWQIDLDAHPVEIRRSAVGLWLIEAPLAHAIWHSYSLSVAHLRPVAGVPDAVIYLRGATHEVVLLALLPEQPRQPFIDQLDFLALTPANFCAQLIQPSDEAAVANVARALPLIAKGELSPDTDFIGEWVALFGDSMLLDRSTRHQESTTSDE